MQPRMDRSDGPAVRYDRIALGAPERTEEGYMRYPVRLAKPGVLVYRTPQGLVRELVPEHTLADPLFLQSLENKPVTLEHPPVLLNPDNVARYRVGTVLSPVTYQDGYVQAVIQVENAEALRAIQSGKVEVSPGYQTDLEETPGTDATFGAYDRIQVRRSAGNHLALTDTARGGHDIRLERGDGITHSGALMKLNPAILYLLGCAGLKPERFDSDEAAAAAMAPLMADPAAAPAVDPAVKADMDPAVKAAKEAELAELKGRIAALEAELAGMPAMPAEVALVAEAGPEPELAMDAKMDSAARTARASARKATHAALLAHHTERSRLDAQAAQLGLKDTAALGNAALRKQIVLAANPQARKDGSADYYRAAYDLLPTGTRQDAADPYRALGADLTQPQTVRQDTAKDRPLTPSAASRKAANTARNGAAQ